MEGRRGGEGRREAGLGTEPVDGCSLDDGNKPETALYRAPTFSLLLASHGGISSCIFL